MPPVSLAALRKGARGIVVRVHDDAQLVAISAYQASLVMPGAMCKAGAAKH